MFEAVVLLVILVGVTLALGYGSAALSAGVWVACRLTEYVKRRFNL